MPCTRLHPAWRPGADYARSVEFAGAWRYVGAGLPAWHVDHDAQRIDGSTTMPHGVILNYVGTKYRHQTDYFEFADHIFQVLDPGNGWANEYSIDPRNRSALRVGDCYEVEELVRDDALGRWWPKVFHRTMWPVMDKQTFLAEILATHAPLAAVVATLADDAWAEPLPDMGDWTRKDALAHVGWWSDHSVRVITALRAGEVPYERGADFDVHVQNRSILEEFRDRDPGEVRGYEANAFERLVAAVEAASDEDLFTVDRFPWLGEDTLAVAVEWDSTKHYPEHLPHLTA